MSDLPESSARDAADHLHALRRAIQQSQVLIAQGRTRIAYLNDLIMASERRRSSGQQATGSP